MSTSEQRALVVGAGIAGLATAVRLRRSGWQVLLVERADAVPSGGYMVGFAGEGIAAAARWGLLPALRELQPALVDMAYVDATGRPRVVLPVAVQEAVIGQDMVALLRGDLESALYLALDEGPGPLVETRFGTTVTAIAQDADGVTARLTDGTVHRVDLLVGADGLHSSVRELAFGPEDAFRTDFGHVMATMPLDHVPADVGPEGAVSMLLVGRWVCVRDTHVGRASAFFAFASSDVESDLADGPRKALRRAFDDLPWVVPDLLDQVDTCDEIWLDRVSQIVMDRWSSGRVVLVGDAAWCVSLFAGCGASLAVGGADLLGELLDEHAVDGRTDVPGALAGWEARLRPTVERAQRRGRRAHRLFLPDSRAKLRAQTMVYRLIGTRPFRTALRRCLDLNTEPQDAGTLGKPRPVALRRAQQSSV